MAADYFLRTERLGFRTWVPGDASLAVELWGDPGVTRFIDARGALTPEQAVERLSREIALEREHGVQYWPVFSREGGAHIGCCGLRPWGDEAGNLELGFHIRSACWRRGYATEAARGVMAHAFETVKVVSLFAGHHPANDVSSRLLRKLGFEYQGKELYPPTGLEHPTYLITLEAYRQCC